MNLDNKVIKLKTIKHGQLVKNFFTRNGYNVKIYSFVCTEETGDSSIYYGKPSDRDFSHFSLEEVKSLGLQIVELEQFGVFLTRSKLVSAFEEFSCEEWREAIQSILTDCFSFRDDDLIFVSNDYIELLRNRGTASQMIYIENLGIKLAGGDVKIEYMSSVKTPEGYILLEIREGGEYKGKAFYLGSGFDWEIKKDSVGSLCLIPKRK